MTIPGIIMTCFIGSFFIIGILSSRMERRQKIVDEEKKAQQNAAAEETKQDELLFISSVAALLPDSDAAIRQLMTRYCWTEIIGTIGLSRLHLTILQMASHDRKVTLPNMQADRYEASEKYVARMVRKTTSPHEDVGFYGVDSFAQEPTAEMLRDLVSSGYITTTVPITKNSREFDCEVTPKGMAILALDMRFCRGDASKTHLWHTLSGEERKVITSVMYCCIQEIQM